MKCAVALALLTLGTISLANSRLGSYSAAFNLAGNASVTPLVLWMSVCGGDHLPSGGPSARLPAFDIKKIQVLGHNDEPVTACVEIFKPMYVDGMCCESIKSINKFDDEIKECNTKAASKEWTCPDYECFLNKRELLKDGKIIDDKATAFFDDIIKNYPKEKNIIERVKMGCLEGQYEEYPPDENCMALKFYACIYTNIMLECDSWKNTKTCKEASDLVKKCKEAK